MSKELVVSATRHETRVAVFEDDQLVEIFYQREKEYSLAGSIHKGRVTRVLPGMQSAFVDIGLERDAFLYVSDFFEDNDEYDKIVTGVEEKVARLEKGLPVAAEPSTAPSQEGEVAEFATLAVPSSAPGVFPRSDRPERSGADRPRDDRQRGGRGRRRGRRGNERPSGNRESGGLPESKYFSPRDRPSETPLEEHQSPVAADTQEYSAPSDLVVLPGESLAKYIAEPVSPVMAEEAQDLEPVAEPEPFLLSPSVNGDGVHAEVEEREVEEREAELEFVSHTEVELISEKANPPAAVEPDSTVSQHDSAVSETAAADLADEVTDSLPDGDDDGLASDAGDAGTDAGDDDELEPADLDLSIDDEPSVLAEEELLSEGSAVPGEEGLGLASAPAGLTAAVREQNPRYQHRVSRRMRRKGRPGENRQTEDRPAGTSADPTPGQSENTFAEISAPETRLPLENRAGSEERRPREERNGREAREPRESREREPREREERSRAPLPSITDLLREGQEIIVQIAKEPIGQKGARITSHVALPGRFLVYMPSVDHIGVSRKIPSDEERSRLKRVLQTHRTGIPGGYIVRTAGDGRTEEELRADMMFLYNLWLDMRQKVEKRPAPQLMHHDLDVVQRILRDQLTSAFKTVWVDNETLYESILSFVQRFQPALVSRVKLYTRPAPIFDEFGISSELEKALRPKVWLKSGGYIVINQTEALVAIDINTGKYVGKSNRLEDTIVKTNTDAIKEIVRQIRLRDLGGIIVVDFIDMDERKNKQKVMQALEEAMRADRAPYKILQFNDFGLVAITRKRVKQSLERTLCTPCTYCEGAGSIKSVQTVISEILGEAHKMAKVLDNDVILRVHPEVAKVLKSNQNDFLQEIEETLGKTVMVKSDPLLHQTKFDLV